MAGGQRGDKIRGTRGVLAFLRYRVLLKKCYKITINVSHIIGLLILLADVDVQLNYQKLLVSVFRFFMTKHAHILLISYFPSHTKCQTIRDAMYNFIDISVVDQPISKLPKSLLSLVFLFLCIFISRSLRSRAEAPPKDLSQLQREGQACSLLGGEGDGPSGDDPVSTRQPGGYKHTQPNVLGGARLVSIELPLGHHYLPIRLSTE